MHLPLAWLTSVLLKPLANPGVTYTAKASWDAWKVTGTVTEPLDVLMI
jgi:hypothetical protein